MTLRTFSRIVLCFLAATMISGCAGYHLGAAKPKFMADVQTIAVPAFKNETLEPRLEVIGAGALIKQLQTDGTYKILPADSADAILQCTITKIQRDSARSVHGNVNATREFELLVRIKMELIRRTTKQVLDSRVVEGRTSFFVGGDIQQQEKQAIPLAVEDAAVSIASIVSEGW